MTSLVAYEDSDSEEPTAPIEEWKGSPPPKSTIDDSRQVLHSQKAEELHCLGLVSNSDSVTFDMGHPGNPKMVSEYRQNVQVHSYQSASGVGEKRYSLMHPPPCPLPRFKEQTASLSGWSAPETFRENCAQFCSVGAIDNLSARQKHFPSQQVTSQAEVNVAKRPQTTQSGIKPYIPKRQRLEAQERVEGQRSAVDCVPSDQFRMTRLLFEVSERVKPFLTKRPGRAKIPKRLLMCLEGHQGPVNTVQWCPVPNLSHLLLSASMDKTAKVWDGAESGRCLRTFSSHSEAVRDALWTSCGRRLLTGSFDGTAMLTDIETGMQIAKLDNQFRVMCLAIHPSDLDVFLCGGYSSAVKAWDLRSAKVVKEYKAAIQQSLDILFLRGGSEFITSSDSVSRDSAERTLIAWDYQTTAKVSNQIYHEKYTCPSLALHPVEDSFVAQTNGDYMAVFSSQQPYRMNKRRRYEGHKVEGYALQCGFSPDGTLLASGSSTGSAHFYDFQSGHALHVLGAHSQPCVCVSPHPVLPSAAATCDWGGQIKVWH